MAKYTGKPSIERLKNQDIIKNGGNLPTSKLVGRATQSIANLQSEFSPFTTGPANKGWRAAILLERSRNGMPKSNQTGYQSYDKKNHHYAKEDSFSEAQRNDPWTSHKVSNVQQGLDRNTRLPGHSYTGPNPEHGVGTSVKKEIHNEIIIINKNVSPAVSLVLQNRPNELDINPQSTWVKVKSMGRNNPFMFYTGGEDTITLNISWYSTDELNRDDVLNKCRLLESWSRANGYLASPPTLEILWGSSGIFENQLFVLESAPYKLTHFQNSEKVTTFRVQDGTTTTEQRDLRLLPNMATQTLTFSRVTADNRTHQDIIPQEFLERTPGIQIEPVKPTP